MLRFNIWELVIIFGGFILMFGAGRLPKLGSAVGEAIRNFKKGLEEGDSEKITIEGNNTPPTLKEQKLND